MNRLSLILISLALFTGCKGEAGVGGNPGSQGSRGPEGAAGTPGAPGAAGVDGQPGLDGLAGGTPILLTNAIDGVIQYGDGDDIVNVGSHTLVAPANGGFMVRVHYRGTVAKRDGVAFCRVALRVRQNDDQNPWLEEILGIHGAPTAGKLELSVGGSMIGLIQRPAQETVTLHLEIQRFDAQCADGAGPTQIARVAAQLEVSYHSFALESPP